jgi:DnaK suppressor protein
MRTLSSDDLKTVRELLLAEKASLLREPRSTLDALRHPGNLSVEDRVPLIHDQFVALNFRRQAYEKLRKVEAALERLSTGEFGICQACEEPIPRKRLLAIPWADLCVPCQEQLHETTPRELAVGLAA